MPAGNPESYLEQCIAALPPEKREAARRAFADISETGDDSYLSKLLAVFEANNAYAKRISKELTEAGGKIVREMTELASKSVRDQDQVEARRDAFLRKSFAEQISALGQSLGIEQIGAEIERQGAVLNRLGQPLAEEKAESGAVTAFLMALAFMAGVALTGWTLRDACQDARQAKSFVDRVADAGIRMQVEKTDTGNRFVITGPVLKGGAWQKGDNGMLNGAEIDFSEPK
jgi:hypothetical protein